MKRVAVLLVLAAGCASAPAPAPDSAAEKRIPIAPPVATAAAPPVLPFIDDDYPRALAEARRTQKPIFVDTWATWCHTCRFMRATVMTDPRLRDVVPRFVWLAIDIDRDENQAFLAKFPSPAVPTMLVINPGHNPGDEHVAVIRSSSASYGELLTLLDEGERRVKGDPGKTPGFDADRAFADGQRLAGAGEAAPAADAFLHAVSAAPHDWPLRRRAVESLVFADSMSGREQACAQWAVTQLADWPPDGLYASVVTTGLGCALKLPKGAVSPTGETRDQYVSTLERDAHGVLSAPDLLVDDRSGVYEALVDARDEAGDETGKHTLALAWIEFLEKEAAAAPTVEARAAYDPHRVNAALALGDPARVLPALLASRRDLPEDYNPPARLAVVYLALNQLDEAKVASDIAVARVYGPRKLNVLNVRAKIFAAEGDGAAQRATIEQALAVAAELPKSPRRDQTIQRLTKERDALR